MIAYIYSATGMVVKNVSGMLCERGTCFVFAVLFCFVFSFFRRLCYVLAYFLLLWVWVCVGFGVKSWGEAERDMRRDCVETETREDYCVLHTAYYTSPRHKVSQRRRAEGHRDTNTNRHTRANSNWYPAFATKQEATAPQKPFIP